MATWFDIQGCAFWSHKDSEWAVILLIQLSLFEWQYGLTYKATPCRSNHIAIQTDIVHTLIKTVSWLGCHWNHLTESFEWQYDLTYKFDLQRCAF